MNDKAAFTWSTIFSLIKDMMSDRKIKNSYKLERFENSSSLKLFGYMWNYYFFSDYQAQICFAFK